MPWSTAKGFGFRSTSGYVTDATNDTYVLLATTYPTTRTVGGDSVTFGWETAPDDSRDRTTSYSPGIAGFNFQNAGGSDRVFRIDLPSAGDYRLRAAFGDPAGNAQGYYVDIRDTSSVLYTLGSATSTQVNALIDPNGTDHYAFNWDANNTTRDSTFSTTIFRVAMRPMTALNNSISYIQLEQLSGGSVVGAARHYYAQQG